MFTWICPQCGREVPPAYDECPDCKERAAQEAGASQPPQAAPPPESQQPPPYPPQGYQQPQYAYPPQYPPQYQQPPQGYPPQGYPPYPPQGYPPQGYPPQGQYPPPYPPPPQQGYQPPPQGGQPKQPAYQPPPPPPQQPPPPPPPAQAAPAPPSPQSQPQVKVRPYTPPEPASGMPSWVLTLLVTAGVLAVVAGAVWLFSSHGHTDAKPSATVESPAAKPGAAANPYQKYIEVAGVRFHEDPKHKDKTEVRFLLVNHSDAEIDDLGGNVTVWGATRKSEEDAQGTFTFKTDLKPLESKELTSPLNSKLKIYELPDWQNVTTDVQITSPKPQ